MTTETETPVPTFTLLWKHQSYPLAIIGDNSGRSEVRMWQKSYHWSGLLQDYQARGGIAEATGPIPEGLEPQRLEVAQTGDVVTAAFDPAAKRWYVEAA